MPTFEVDVTVNGSVSIEDVESEEEARESVENWSTDTVRERLAVADHVVEDAREV